MENDKSSLGERIVRIVTDWRVQMWVSAKELRQAFGVTRHHLYVILKRNEWIRRKKYGRIRYVWDEDFCRYWAARRKPTKLEKGEGSWPVNRGILD